MSIIFQTIFNLLRKKDAAEKDVAKREDEDLTYASGMDDARREDEGKDKDDSGDGNGDSESSE